MKFPPHFDKAWFVTDYAWTGARVFQLNDAGDRVVDSLTLFNSFGFSQPLDFKQGPDGALYTVNYGGAGSSTRLAPTLHHNGHDDIVFNDEYFLAGRKQNALWAQYMTTGMVLKSLTYGVKHSYTTEMGFQRWEFGDDPSPVTAPAMTWVDATRPVGSLRHPWPSVGIGHGEGRGRLSHVGIAGSAIGSIGDPEAGFAIEVVYHR